MFPPMFTGLVEETGEVVRLERSASGAQLAIRASLVTQDVRIGDSIAVNGCCLTVTSHHDGELTFDLLTETLLRTNLEALAPGAPVNLERAVLPTSRMGGHFVQGHIDCVSEILHFAPEGSDYRLEITLPSEFAALVAFKGSIAVDGISLTVAKVLPDRFVLWIIPHTLAVTSLRVRRPGDRVNLEFDLVARYLDRMLTVRGLPARP